MTNTDWHFQQIFNSLFNQTSFQDLLQVGWVCKVEHLTLTEAGFLYRTDAFTVTKTAVPRHWRELGTLVPPTGTHLFSILQLLRKETPHFSCRYLTTRIFLHVPNGTKPLGTETCCYKACAVTISTYQRLVHQVRMMQTAADSEQ